ncbi:unnamed protein product, partial [Adineta steineri]
MFVNDIIKRDDFNNDNYIDISYTASHSSRLLINMRNPSKGFSRNVSESVGYLTYPNALATGHLNNDTYKDIALTNYYTDYLTICFGSGDGKFERKEHLTTNRLRYSRSIAVADINHDLVDDIIVSNSDHNTISVFINRGDGNFHDEKLSYLLT